MKDHKKKAVTLAELAKRLNLSAAAVSRALHERESTIRVSPETVARVRAMAAEVGYRPNRMARALRTGRSGMIGILSAPGMDYLTSQHLYYARTNTVRMGLMPIIHEVAGPADEHCNLAVEMMSDAKVDGVVLIRVRSPIFLQFSDVRIPVVGIGAPKMRGVPRFCPDGVSGMADLTRHMIDVGCRDLVLITPYTEVERRRTQWSIENGFEFAIGEAKRKGINVKGRIKDQTLQFDGLKVKEAPHMHGLHAGGYLAMKQLIAADKLPDGVIGNTDNTAQGALTACSEAGIEVPGQIAFAGFGDAPSSSAGYLPLTSVAHPLEEIHRRAFTLLESMIAKKSAGADSLELLPCELVARKSSGVATHGH